jgi:methylglutaconyl-CoA hydratase
MTATTLCLDARGVATLTLNRPAVHNAFDDALISELAGHLQDVEADRAVRAVILAAEGKSFSAGADLTWMRRLSAFSEAENVADAMRLAELMRRLDGLAKPTLALVQGAAYGGGVGLVAACDIAIAAEEAVFSLSEVKLGLLPAVISPYVVAAIGPRAARRYFLTAERFSAAEAFRLGLIHEIVPKEKLAEAGERVIAALAEGGPQAQACSKQLIAEVASRPVTDALVALTARRIAEARASDEGKEGVAAFLEKRKPSWRG